MEEQKYSAEIRHLLEEIQLNRGKNPKLLLEACDQLELQGRKTSDEALLGYAFFSRGETYYLLNDANNFYTNMFACLEPMEHIKEWGYLAMADNMLGIMSVNRGNALFALDYYINAISICQECHLPDIEWIIHMNLGSLYLNIEEYIKSLNHTENSFRYLLDNPEIENYRVSLTSVCLGMGRAYLKLEREDKVLQLCKRLKNECMPFINDMEKLVVYCFFARVHQFLGESEARDFWIEKVNENASAKMPIMDVFDDFYEYLVMLLSIERYEDFFKIYVLMDDLTKRTTIKNLEKKLLNLKIRYFRKTGQIEEYKLSAVLFYEISEYMERENRVMVKNMLVMRNSFNELTQINRKVEQQNTFLQKRSETDPLTGLYNRLKLNEHSDEVFSKAIVNKSTIAFEILDIDYFKQYNDNYGHQAGDECIKFIASKLMEISSVNNIFTARYGGDEFVIIYEGFTEDEIQKKTSELRKMILDENFEHKFSLVSNKVTISQGVCIGTPTEGQSAYAYLKIADEMLYKAKEKSRNSFLICNLDKK